MDTYQVWKFQLNILLQSNDLTKHIENLIPEKQRTADWKKKDANAQKMIIMTIDKKPLMHIINCGTAYEMWIKLQAIYERNKKRQKCNLLQEFFLYTFDKDTDMATHISRLENLSHRLKSLEADVNEDMLISKILVTLPEKYKHFATAWESTPLEDKKIENLTARLLAEELRGSTVKESPVALKN